MYLFNHVSAIISELMIFELCILENEGYVVCASHRRIFLRERQHEADAAEAEFAA